MNIASSKFLPIDIKTGYTHCISDLKENDCSREVRSKKEYLLTGENVLWGIPFKLGDEQNNNVIIANREVRSIDFKTTIEFENLIFLHSADFKEPQKNAEGLYGRSIAEKIGETLCEYRMTFDNGKQETIPVRRFFNINEFMHRWGEHGFECVPHIKPYAFDTDTDVIAQGKKPQRSWGFSQLRTFPAGMGAELQHWLYAYKNPYPGTKLVSLEIVPKTGVVFLFGLTATQIKTNPLRWESRKKLKLELPEEYEINKTVKTYEPLIPELSGSSSFKHIGIDMGEIISVSPCLDYENEVWEERHNNKEPKTSKKCLMIEYAAHEDACIYLGKNFDIKIPVSSIISEEATLNQYRYLQVSEQKIPVTLKVIEAATGKKVPVKIHIHGEHGEYITPVNRHRIPNPHWFEDYSAEFVFESHYCTYIDGQAEYKMPAGWVYIEVSKGFEVQPVHQRVKIDADTREIIIEIKKASPWREKGWITADTHVHFLSPQTSLLEGSAEGVNVVNLLASQWGELFTNIADFDGKTIHGAIETGGDGEYLVKVGTENRQHILGHISLLGYDGEMILPLTTGGPDESALGDPIEKSLTEWARECKKKNGLVIIPHFPHPRGESAASIVLGDADGVEMTSWGDLYGGLNPYSLSDWYKYLNCGYQVPAVGGTDKMSARTAVGTVRTYVKLGDDLFTYDNWKKAMLTGNTFVTYGPLMDFKVEGKNPGDTIHLTQNGGTLEMEYTVASMNIPVSKIELVVNGETMESKDIGGKTGEFAGKWSINVAKSCWLALRVRGRYPGKQEMIAAHSSSIMVLLDGKECFDALDAATIIEQIEGVTAYIKTLGTKAEEKRYKQILEGLLSAHRRLHNRMHQSGMYHKHSVLDEHHK